jgi:hypothetical protein
LVLTSSSSCLPNFLGALEKLRSQPGPLPVGRPPPLVSARRRRRPGVVRTVRTQGSDGPRLVQMIRPFWPGCLSYLQGAAQVLFYFLFLWPFAFPQQPLVSISFAVVGIVDVCH